MTDDNLLLKNKQLAVKLLHDNLITGNVVIDQVIAIQRYEYADFQKLQELLGKWRAIYEDASYTDLQAFNVLSNEIFILLVQGRIMGWIYGKFKE